MRVTQGKKRKVNKLRVFIIACVLVFLFIFISSIKNIIFLHLEQGELKKEQTELKEQKKSLEGELKEVNDPEYIEEQARKQLKLIKPGEHLYILDDEEKQDK